MLKDFFKFCISTVCVFLCMICTLSFVGEGYRYYQQNMTPPHVAVVEIKGMMGDYIPIVQSLRYAFHAPESVAVVLDISSSGGYSNTADEIGYELLRLKARFPKKKLFAYAKKDCFSAAYHIASYADEIYVDHFCGVGSIGVRSGQSYLNIEELAKKTGLKIEHGSNYFRPLNAKEGEGFLKDINDSIQETYHFFVNVVKTNRGKKLKEHPDMFEAGFFTAQDAKTLGLIDDVLTLDEFLKKLPSSKTIYY